MPSSIKVTVFGDTAPLNVAMGSAAKTLEKFGGDAVAASNAVIASTVKQREALMKLSEQYKAVAGSSTASAEEQRAAADLAAAADAKLVAGMQAVRAEAVKTTATFEEAGTAGAAAATKIGSAFKLGAIAAVAGLGVAAIVLDKTAKAALAAQVATARLDAAFKNAGLSAKAFSKEIDAAESSGRSLGFTNEEVKQALGSLVTATGNVGTSTKDLSVAEDLARFKGIALNDATKMLTMAMTGSQRAIKQLGITIIPVTSNVQALRNAHYDLTTAAGQTALAHAKLLDKLATGNEIMAAVTAKTHGMADAFSKTAAGSLQVLKAQFESLKVSIGDTLLPVLADAAKGLGDFFGKVNAAQGFSAKMKVIFDGIGSLATDAWNALKAAFNAIDWGAVWSGVGRAISAGAATVKAGFQALPGLAVQAYDALKKGFDSVNWGSVWASVSTGLASGLSSLSRFGQQAYNALSASLKNVNWRGLFTVITDAVGQFGKDVSNGIVAALNGISAGISKVNWSKVGTDILKGLEAAIATVVVALAKFIGSTNWIAVAEAIGRALVAINVALVKVVYGIGSTLAGQLVKGIIEGLGKLADAISHAAQGAWLGIEKGALEAALTILKALDFTVLGVHIIPGVHSLVKNIEGELGKLDIKTPIQNAAAAAVSTASAAGTTLGDAIVSSMQGAINAAGGLGATRGEGGAGGPNRAGAAAGAAAVQGAGGSTKLSNSQIYSLLIQAGFSPSSAQYFVGIAGAESAGQGYSAFNNNPGTGDLSAGLWQENFYQNLGPSRVAKYAPQFGMSANMPVNSFISWLLKNPAAQAKIAYEQSSGGTNVGPWAGDSYVASHPGGPGGTGGSTWTGGGTGPVDTSGLTVKTGKAAGKPGGITAPAVAAAAKQVASDAAKAAQDIAGGLPGLAVTALQKEAKDINSEMGKLTATISSKKYDTSKTKAELASLATALDKVHDDILKAYAADLKKEESAAAAAGKSAVSAFAQGKDSAAVNYVKQQIADLKKAQSDLVILISKSKGTEKTAYEAELKKIDAELSAAQKDLDIPGMIADSIKGLAAKFKELSAKFRSDTNARAAAGELAAVGYFQDTAAVLTGMDKDLATDLENKVTNLKSQRAVLQASLTGKDSAQRAAINAKIKGITGQITSLGGDITSALGTVEQDLANAVTAAQGQFSTAIGNLQTDLATQIQKNAEDSSGYTSDAATLAGMQAADQLKGLTDSVTAAQKALDADTAAGSTATADQIAQDKAALDSANRALAEYNLGIRASTEQAAATADATKKTNDFNTGLSSLDAQLLSGQITAKDYDTQLAALIAQTGVNVSASATLTSEFALAAAAASGVESAFDSLIHWINSQTGSSIPDVGTTTTGTVGPGPPDSPGRTGNAPATSTTPPPPGTVSYVGNTGGGSCFVAGTQVSTPEGLVSIEDLMVGDVVCVWDFEHQDVMETPITETFVHEEQPVIQVGTSGGDVKVTVEHLIFTGTEWVAAGSLRAGSSVALASAGTLHTGKVNLVAEQAGLHTVYNIHVAHPDHNYFANGLLVHNVKVNPTFMGGGIVHAMNGMMLQGPWRGKDYIPVLANGGEMILNPTQQTRLWQMISGSGGGAQPVQGGGPPIIINMPNYMGDKREMVNLLRQEFQRIGSRNR